MREDGLGMPVPVDAHRRDLPRGITVVRGFDLMTFATFEIFPEQCGCRILLCQFAGAFQSALNRIVDSPAFRHIRGSIGQPFHEISTQPVHHLALGAMRNYPFGWLGKVQAVAIRLLAGLLHGDRYEMDAGFFRSMTVLTCHHDIALGA